MATITHPPLPCSNARRSLSTTSGCFQRRCAKYAHYFLFFQLFNSPSICRYNMASDEDHRRLKPPHPSSLECDMDGFLLNTTHPQLTPTTPPGSPLECEIEGLFWPSLPTSRPRTTSTTSHSNTGPLANTRQPPRRSNVTSQPPRQTQHTNDNPTTTTTINSRHHHSRWPP